MFGGRSLASAVPQAWELAAVAADYRRFLQRFGAVIDRFRVAGPAAHDPAQCFIVRTLLIHEYRRVLLRDPQLPADAASARLAGRRRVCAVPRLLPPHPPAAERHLMATLEDPGRAAAGVAGFYARFGGPG